MCVKHQLCLGPCGVLGAKHGCVKHLPLVIDIDVDLVKGFPVAPLLIGIKRSCPWHAPVCVPCGTLSQDGRISALRVEGVVADGVATAWDDSVVVGVVVMCVGVMTVVVVVAMQQRGALRHC